MYLLWSVRFEVVRYLIECLISYAMNSICMSGSFSMGFCGFASLVADLFLGERRLYLHRLLHDGPLGTDYCNCFSIKYRCQLTVASSLLSSSWSDAVIDDGSLTRLESSMHSDAVGRIKVATLIKLNYKSTWQGMHETCEFRAEFCLISQ